MTDDDRQIYDQIRGGGAGFFEQPRGLIAVSGKEAVQFLDGLISNDLKTLADGDDMLAAFPNAQGRLLAMVRVMRQGERFLFETEEATREKIFNNLFRFTFAGDFFVEDLSEKYNYFELFGDQLQFEVKAFEGSLSYESSRLSGIFVRTDAAAEFRNRLLKSKTKLVSDKLYETMRIEYGMPKYGVDMDEATIVPELGLDEMISYEKGCYIGQEIIARIHFRGHIAKQLTGLTLSTSGAVASGSELQSGDGKNAGRVTSVTHSPKLGKDVALALVRYDYLEKGTELSIGETTGVVTELPIVT